MIFAAIHTILRVTDWKKICNFLANTINKRSKKWHFKTMPSFVSVEPSSVCNLCCPECAIGTHQTIRSNHKISLELYHKLVEEIKPFAFHVQLFFQGEPLLNENIDEMVVFARNNRLATTISTNAMKLDRDMSKRLVKAQLDRLIVSIDGTTQQTYETYRRGGNLQTVIDNVKQLIEIRKQHNSKYPIVECQMIVFSHNEHQINDFKQLVKSIGADHATIKSAQIYDFQSNSQLIPKNERYARYIKRSGTWQLKKPITNQCDRIYKGCVVNSDGLVTVCCFDKIPNHPVGNLNNSTLNAIWNGDEFVKFRAQVSTNRHSIFICENCSE